MATLNGSKIKDTYPLLLKIDTGGIDGTLRTVEDGDATASALQISTVGVKSTGTLAVDGVSTLTGNTTIGGSLGIGITPYNKLTIKQNSADAYGIVIEALNNDKWLRLGHNSTYGVIETTYNSTGGESDLHIRTNSSNSLILQTTGGNVGIGTASPSYTLDVNGTGRFSGAVTVSGNTTDSYITSFSQTNTTADHSFGVLVRGGTNVNDVAFRVQNAAANSNLFTVVGSGEATFSSTVSSTRLLLPNGAYTRGIHTGGSGHLYFTNGINGIADLVIGNTGSLTLGSTHETGIYPLYAGAAKFNGNVGIGTTPSYQLHLSTDSAAKPTSNTWTVSSDERIKENIELANLQTCFENIKNLKLKRFTYKQEVFSKEQVKDRTQLGFIAQEVEPIFPKAISKNDLKYNQKFEDVIIAAKFDENGIEIEAERIEKKLISEDIIKDCYGLDSSQIIWALYGAVQHLIAKVEALEAK